MNKKSKMILLVLLLTLAVFSFSACTAKKTDEKVSAEKKEITFMIPDWGVPSDELLAQFKEKTGISVTVDVVSWDDIRNKVSVAAGGKKAPADVVEVDWAWVGEFKSAGWLEPIKLSQEEQEKFPSIKSFKVGEDVYALPYANDFRLAFYNKEHYDKAGIQNPPKTFEEVYQNSKLIKEKGIVEYPYTFPFIAEESTTTALIWMTFIRDGKIFNDDDTLNKENVMKTLNYLDKMNKEGLINPANRTAKGMDTYRQIARGEASYLIGPTSFVGRVNNPEQSTVIGEVKPVLLPAEKDFSNQTMALPEGIGVLKYSENKEAATEFVKWYTSEEVQEQLFKDNNTIPTRTTVLEKLVNEDAIKDSGAMLEVSKLIKSPFPNGVPNYYTQMSNAMFNAVNKMANLEYSPEQAFDEMNTKINELVAKNK